MGVAGLASTSDEKNREQQIKKERAIEARLVMALLRKGVSEQLPNEERGMKNLQKIVKSKTRLKLSN